MNFILENLGAIIGAIIILVVVVFSVYEYSKMPKEELISDLKEWLLFAVVEAEKYFGGKMGAMKLRYVYDLFLSKFPALATLITFEKFSEYVDEALEKMKQLIESNTKLSEYIEG